MSISNAMDMSKRRVSTSFNIWEDVYIPYVLYVKSMRKNSGFIIAKFIEEAVNNYINEVEIYRAQILNHISRRVTKRFVIYIDTYEKLKQYSHKLRLTMSDILSYCIQRALNDKCYKLAIAQNIVNSLGGYYPGAQYSYHHVINVLKKEYSEFEPIQLMYTLIHYGIIRCVDKKCKWITINYEQLLQECQEIQRSKIKIVKPYRKL